MLAGSAIEFRSTSAEPGADGAPIKVEGELTIAGRTEPIAFDLASATTARCAAAAVVKQSDWGIKPYTALFGALKVRDEVEVVLEGHLSRAQSR